VNPRVYQEDLERALLAAGSEPVDLSGAEALDLNALGILLVHLEAGGRWIPPASPAVRSWLARIGFDAARGGASAPPDHSDVLLGLTRIASDADVGELVERVRVRAASILRGQLGHDENDVRRFCVALSELCQNIPEHAESAGWAAIHRYVHLGRTVVKIAVVDGGRGVRASLAARRVFGSDLEALKAAFFENLSRHDDPGRGHGLRQVRRLAEKWGAKLTMRSGTAKVAVAPPGMRGIGKPEGLARVPGTQVLLAIPQLRRKS